MQAYLFTLAPILGKYRHGKLHTADLGLERP